MNVKRIAIVAMGLIYINASAAEFKPLISTDRLKDIPWIDKIAKRKNQVWRPKYDKSNTVTTKNIRLVSYAGKWTRHSFGGHDGVLGSAGWRYPISPIWKTRAKAQDVLQFVYDTDIDGDGKTADDIVISSPFSLDIPFNADAWPLSHTLPERLSAKFYGGWTAYTANNDIKSPKFIAEWGLNADHAGCIYDSRAEDHPFNAIKNKKAPDSFVRFYVSMVWKKEDFLSDGDKFKVSFDDTSRMSTFCMRYYYAFNDIRMIVKEGEQFYISELAPNIPNDAFNSKRYRFNAFNPIMYPTKLKWAKYNPNGYNLDFDPSSAKLEKVQFKDVQAVGWYIAKTDTSGANAHTKWYGFECEAVITVPEEPSCRIEMKTIKGKKSDFSMAITELPYSLYQDIYVYGNSPQTILDPRYVYDKSGSMGSMAFGNKEHGHEEPLTDITFYDALAICNTLSELEGKTPCYYIDAEYKMPFRNQHIATIYDYKGRSAFRFRNFESPTLNPQPLAKVYVKWGADGHRLPTVSEWKSAFDKDDIKEETVNVLKTGTQPVGTKQANKNGIYDMMGNVWELCWTFGDVYEPEKNPVITALGGDYNYPNSPEAIPVSKYGDDPYSGLANIGIRLVARTSGLPKPEMGDVSKEGISMAGIPQWGFKKGSLFGKKEEAKKVSSPILDMVKIPAGTHVRHDKKTIKIAEMEYAKYTTTYSKWIKVYKWAVANGYSFCMNGDMGSMKWFDYTHSPEEPVTNITWFDALTWCNALSEMEGKTPCYYYDESKTKVVRKGHSYKPIKLAGDYYIPSKRKRLGATEVESNPYIFVAWDSDGYRLPTLAEMEYVIRCGKANDYKKLKTEDRWGPENGEGRTHKVGLKRKNPFGLYDIQGNVFEYAYCGSGNKFRPYKRDLDNPMVNPFASWQKDKSVAGGLSPRRKYVSGPSFLTQLTGAMDGRSGMGGYQQYTDHYYSDLSFRPVRCKKGTHPKDMHRPLEEEVIIKYIEADKGNDYKFGE